MVKQLHGFRATARTLLDEVLKFPIERIEQQLAHQVRDIHGRAYNRTKYLEERTVMMQSWSDYLEQLYLSLELSCHHLHQNSYKKAT